MFIGRWRYYSIDHKNLVYFKTDAIKILMAEPSIGGLAHLHNTYVLQKYRDDLQVATQPYYFFFQSSWLTLNLVHRATS